MLKRREYRLLRDIYGMNPTMDDEQRYTHHFISKICDATKIDENDVLSMLKSLETENYVRLINNTNDYIHTAAITPHGVSSFMHYKEDWWWQLARNILIPAVVSIICSLVVYFITA